MKFAEVIGQEELKTKLIQMIDGNKVPHAMLLCGPQGCGKMAVALAMASYLLGEKDTKGEEQTARQRNIAAMLERWNHPDLHFSFPVIRPTGTSSEHKMTSDDFIKEWKDMLCEGAYFNMDRWLTAMNAANQQAQIGVGESDLLIKKLSIKSSQGGYKVSIIWLPERMNGECANKLLKIIEEPPQQTIFIMVSEEPEKLLETIKSRTQRIDLKKIDNESVTKALIEKRLVSEEAARRIARVANGNWTKALEELDTGNENRQFLDMFILLMRLAYSRNIKELKKWSEAAAGFGREKQKRMLVYFLRLIRENFVYNFRNAELNYMTQEEEDFARKFARFINEANVMEMADMTTKAIRDIGQNANAKIVFFEYSLRTIMLLLQQ
ncbi:MAG: DNA polymerase III subunit delta [Prevotella sp.]|nr:DNA polymerase III subunit delta [Prevotella sp.]